MNKLIGGSVNLNMYHETNPASRDAKQPRWWAWYGDGAGKGWEHTSTMELELADPAAHAPEVAPVDTHSPVTSASAVAMNFTKTCTETCVGARCVSFTEPCSRRHLAVEGGTCAHLVAKTSG